MFRVQALACVYSKQQPKRYHPTRAARVGTPGLDSKPHSEKSRPPPPPLRLSFSKGFPEAPLKLLPERIHCVLRLKCVSPPDFGELVNASHAAGAETLAYGGR